MKTYSIRQIRKSELPKLQDFINTHWKRNHALVLSQELLDYQHLNGEMYNFLVAENNDSKEFDALVGFISTAQFDPALEDNGDYWGAIWKIREDIENEELNTAGFVLWKSLFKLPHFHSYGALGISEIAKRIYIASRLQVDCYKQYYILNDSVTDFKIAYVPSRQEKIVAEENRDWRIRPISGEELHRLKIAAIYRPQKSITYLINRYANHPVYSYDFYGIYHQDKLKSIWVARQMEVEGSIAIRIIDVLGELGGFLHSQLQRLMKEKNAEYIDFLNYGISEAVFHEMGFSTLDVAGETIIPNYFEPFLRSNIRVDLAYRADYDYVAFKGDSDQDRPNLLNIPS